MRFAALCFVLMTYIPAYAQTPAAANQYRGILIREAHVANGLNAPIPMYAAQIEQESGWRAGITAWDNGRGLAQFMDGTAGDISRLYPALGTPQPYNATWAIRALVRYDTYLGQHVKAVDDCQRSGAALSSYNGGLGYVMQSQKASPKPATWFGVTEAVPSKQSKSNFAASRSYPRKILFDRQPKYRLWGAYTCKDIK